MPVGYESLALAALVVACGYFVFGLSGFGAAIITVPVLSHLWPVQFVLPMLSLLDLVAGISVGVRGIRQAERGELKRMIPFALAGAALGVTLLVNLPRDAALASLGTFATLYGVYALMERGALRRAGRGWAYPAGFAGGACGALFGIGGPPYVIYLSRRIEDKGALRATVASMISVSVTTRLVLFLLVGLLPWEKILTALALLPFAAAGLWAGSHAHVHVSRERLGRIIGVLLVATGISLLARALS